MTTNYLRHFTASLALGLFTTIPVHADIVGFGDFSGFTVNQNDSGSPATVSGSGSSTAIELTNNSWGEVRSIFGDTPQSISHFSASFTYQAGPGNGGSNFAFVLQDSSAGASAYGSGWNINAPDDYGNAGIGNSAAVVVGSSAEFVSSGGTAVYTGGNEGDGVSMSPVNVMSGDPILVSLSYNGSVLQETLTDLTTNDTFNRSYLINLASVIGGPTAYVGITASSDNYYASSLVEPQYFSGFAFTANPTPEPASWVLAVLGLLGLLSIAKRRRNAIRTTAGPL